VKTIPFTVRIRVSRTLTREELRRYRRKRAILSVGAAIVGVLLGLALSRFLCWLAMN
jgi:hypothetical protein